MEKELTIVFSWHYVWHYSVAGMINIVLHEAGHLLAGWTVGHRGARLIFGTPPGRRVQLPLGVLRVVIYLGWGLILARAWVAFTEKRKDSPLKRIAFFAGGPAASALCLILLQPFLFGAIVPMPWRTPLVASALLLTVLTLLPRSYRWHVPFPSDGLQIVWAFKEWRSSNRAKAASGQ